MNETNTPTPSGNPAPTGDVLAAGLVSYMEAARLSQKELETAMQGEPPTTAHFIEGKLNALFGPLQTPPELPTSTPLPEEVQAALYPAPEPEELAVPPGEKNTVSIKPNLHLHRETNDFALYFDSPPAGSHKRSSLDIQILGRNMITVSLDGKQVKSLYLLLKQVFE